MSEEIYVLPWLERKESPNSPRYGWVQDELRAWGGQWALLYWSYNLSNIKRTDLLHFEGSSIQVSIFPSKFISIWVILELLLCIVRYSAYENILKFVSTNDSVVI